MTRTGKIARLPRSVREQLNRRLQDGEPGTRLVKWLNVAAEVQSMLAEEFGGRAINEQNLSEWKQGGYRDWLAQQEALEMIRRTSADAEELKQASPQSVTDTLALWLAARYAVAARSLAAEAGKVDWKRWRELSNDVVALRRGDHYAERLRIERERLEFDRERLRELREEDFEKWAQQPEIRERICQGLKSRAEKMERLAKIFGTEWDARSAPARNADANPSKTPGTDAAHPPAPSAPMPSGPPESPSTFGSG